MIEEFAKLLNITVEKAIELYPLIQHQFVIYKILSLCQIISIIAAIILGVISLMSRIFANDEYEDKEIDRYKKLSKQSLIGAFVSLFVFTVISVALYISAPDFMLIKEILTKQWR
jgi:hypothetical protein